MFNQLRQELPCKVEVLEGLIQTLDKEFHQMFYESQSKQQVVDENAIKQWCQVLVSQSESKLFQEQKSLVEIVKQKHA